MAKTIENDAAAYIRSFVAKRSRNAQMAEKGVIESKSFTEAEALKHRLIDGIAKDIDEIISQFDAKEVQRFSGEKQVLELKGASLQEFEMTLRQKVLTVALNPNVALILGLIGLPMRKAPMAYVFGTRLLDFSNTIHLQLNNVRG